MYELLYTSHTVDLLSDDQLANVLSTSRANNLALNITGLLMYHQQQVVQLLEGPKDQVLALYAKIHDDCRHESVRVAYQSTIAQRAFSGWSMAFSSLDPANQLTQLIGYEDMNCVQSPQNLIARKPEHELVNTGKDLLLFFLDEIRQNVNDEITDNRTASMF